MGGPARASLSGTGQVGTSCKVRLHLRALIGYRSGLSLHVQYDRGSIWGADRRCKVAAAAPFSETCIKLPLQPEAHSLLPGSLGWATTR